jgi:hypothetical protein
MEQTEKLSRMGEEKWARKHVNTNVQDVEEVMSL